MGSASTKRQVDDPDRVGARTAAWPWFVAAVWVFVVAQMPWLVLSAARSWNHLRDPRPVVHGGFEGPDLSGIYPAASMLGFLALMTLPLMIGVVLGLGASSIGRRTRSSRRRMVALFAALVVSAMFPWLVGIVQSGSTDVLSARWADGLGLVVGTVICSTVPLVAYGLIGPLAFVPGYDPLTPPPAGCYADP